MSDRIKFVNVNICPGCGKEMDPRRNTTEDGYCGLMCVMDEAEREAENEEESD